MKRMIQLLSATLFLSGAVNAQSMTSTAAMDGERKGHEQNVAEQRATAYASMLGLDEQTKESMLKVFSQGEEQIAPLHARRAELDAKIEESWGQYDKQAEQLLTKEQAAKLEKMRKEGKWDPAACAKMDAASCAGKAGASAGGCCAGKAGAKAGSKAEAKPNGKEAQEPTKPNATMK